MVDAEVRKVRNARRPTLQDVAGGEISLERYRAGGAAGQTSGAVVLAHLPGELGAPE